MADILITAKLENAPVIKALQEIDRQTIVMYKTGDKNMKKMARSMRHSMGGMPPLIKRIAQAYETAMKTGDKVKKIEGFTETEMSVEQLQKRVISLLGTLNQYRQETESMKEVPFNVPGVAAGNLRRADFSRQFGTERAGIKFKELEGVINEMMNSTEARAQQLGVKLNAVATSYFKDSTLQGKELDKVMNELLKDGKAFRDAFAKGEDVEALEEKLQLRSAQIQLNETKKVADDLMSTTSKEAQEAGKEIKELADKYEQSMNANQKVTKETATGMRQLKTRTKEVKNEYKDLVDEAKKTDLQKAIDKVSFRNAQTEIKRLGPEFRNMNAAIKAMANSTDASVQKQAQAYQKLRVELVKAYKKGEISAEEFVNAVRATSAQAVSETKKIPGAMDEVGQSAKKANVSIWKLGFTFDRLGARAPGAALRIVDAFKGIHPAVIAAAIAIAGVTIAVKKLVEVVVKLGTEAAKAFARFVQESVKVSKSMELTILQFQNFEGFTEDMAKGLKNFLLDESFRVGVDLMDQFARMLVPMAKDLGQVSQAAEIASTLMNRSGQSMDSVVRGMTQAIAGNFQTLGRTFAIPEDVRENIKRLQEEMGPLEGLLKGLNDYLGETGLAWDTYGVSLTRAAEAAEAFKKRFQDALGEPIKDELAESLKTLLDFIEANKDDILEVARIIGEGIANVLDTVVSAFSDLTAGMTSQDWADIKDDLATMAASLEMMMESLLGMVNADTSDLVNAFDTLAQFVAWASYETAKLALQLRLAYKYAEAIWKVGLPASPADLLMMTARGPGDFLEVAGDVSELVEEYKALEEAYANLDERSKEIRKSAATDPGALDPNADLAGREPYTESDAEDEAEKIADAYERVNEAILKANNDYNDKLYDIRVKAARARIKLEIDHSRDIAKIHRKYRDKELEEIIKHHHSRIEAVENFTEKEEDIERRFTDKTEDIEASSADKRIKIEEDYQRKLADIRRRFDFDAAEAIRQNDAVALLRIRRRMRLELATAKEKRDQDVEDEGKNADKKRKELEKWREREIRDNDIAERRKLDDLNEAFVQRIQAMQRQTANEKRERDIAYGEAIQDQNARLRQELEDFNTWWDNKIRDLGIQYDEYFKTIVSYENSITTFLQNARRIQQGLFLSPLMGGAQLRSLTTMQGVSNLAGIVSGIFGTGLRGQPARSQFPHTPQPPPPTTVVPPQETYDEVKQLRDLAIRYATRVGVSSTIINQIARETRAYMLRRWIEHYKDMPPRRQFGGYAMANSPYWVGERGPEPIIPTRHSIIAPNSLMMSPAMGGGATTNIDNSRSLNTGDIHATDPSQLDPIQETIIRGFVTQAILDTGI